MFFLRGLGRLVDGKYPSNGELTGIFQKHFFMFPIMDDDHWLPSIIYCPVSEKDKKIQK